MACKKGNKMCIHFFCVCAYIFKKTPMKENMFLALVSIWNLYSDHKQWAWEVENYQKEVISLIKYTCAPKYGREFGLTALSTGTMAILVVTRRDWWLTDGGRSWETGILWRIVAPLKGKTVYVWVVVGVSSTWEWIWIL